MRAPVTIFLSGMIAGDPWQGGATWAVLQYWLGFRQLGHKVYFIEPIQPRSLQPAGTSLADSENARYFRRVLAEFGLEASAALVLAGTRETVGLPYEGLCSLARSASVLVNISGMLTDEALIASIPIRAYLDLDPAFNQLWHAIQGIDMRFASHTHFFTIGQAIGQPDCPVPTCGLNWQRTLQPLVLSYWPRSERITCDALTTVGNWRGYGSIEHQGVLYGQKAHSLRQFIGLPRLTREKFNLALAIHPHETRDLAALALNGWQLSDPAEVARTPRDYQQFVQGSRAEFGLAKSGYVASHCGWFSDRSVCYLASGRPVLAQETGFSRYLPTGAGLLSFQDSESALEGMQRIRADYPHHCRKAREIAEAGFDSNKVLDRLLAEVGI